MSTETYDLIVIGGGPAGYVAAIKAAQLGMKTLCVEKRGALGGTCLNVGCIPSKALLHASAIYEAVSTDAYDAMGIKVKKAGLDLEKFLGHKDKIVKDLTKGIEFLFKKYGVDYKIGHGSLGEAKGGANRVYITAEKGKPEEITGKNVLIATGSKVLDLPDIAIDEKHIISSTGALDLESVPEHLVVIGGGYIGLELGSVWRRLGAKVTVMEFQDRIVPMMDRELGAALLKSLKKQGIEFLLKTKVTGVETGKKGLSVTYEPAAGDSEAKALKCDKVLSCIGRQPNTDGLGLSDVGIACDDRGRIQVDDQYQTALDHVYAVGDVIHGPMLAHKAEEEAIAVVESLAGGKGHVNYNAIPSVIYTQPEVASVGATEEELTAEDRPYRVGKFSFSANSRARANSDTEGFVKLLVDEKTDEILGAHLIHSEAGTMIAECVLAMEYRASSEDIARTSHAHPTVNEAIREAALAAYAKPIHS